MCFSAPFSYFPIFCFKRDGESGRPAETTAIIRASDGLAGPEGAKKTEDLYTIAPIDKSASKPGSYFGPKLAPTNVRVTCRFDYQPDICKDYFETGYCGYGDNCKFAHIREDYKSGSQLEREFEEEQKRKEEELKNAFSALRDEDDDGDDDGAKDGAKDGDGDGDADETGIAGGDGGGGGDDGLPWACWICREKFKDPIVTKCHHYFCANCAMTRYRTTRKCAACGKDTEGIFNTAHEIVAKMKKEEQK
jgi:RING finger protein 113A